MVKVLFIYFLFFATARSDAKNYLLQDDWLEDRSERKDRRESMVIWRLTEELDLSSEQAEKFFPRFREHREKLDEIAKNERKILMDVRLKIRDNIEISESEMKKTIKTVAEIRKDRVDLESKFILKMDDILNPSQMIKLSVFKLSLMKEMQSMIKDRKGKDRKRNRMNTKRGGRKRDRY